MRLRPIVPILLGLFAQAFTTAVVRSQSTPALNREAQKASMAITYSPQRETVTGSGNSFWLQGGGADADLPLAKGFKAAVAVHGSSIGTTSSTASGAPGAGLSLLTFAAGPRYFIPHLPRVAHRFTGVFLESLFGVVHGFNSTFPAGGSIASSANSFAMQLGGGIDLQLTGRLGVRVVQADYLRSTLPNAGSNSQNGIQLGAGLQVFMGKK